MTSDCEREPCYPRQFLPNNIGCEQGVLRAGKRENDQNSFDQSNDL